MTTTATVGFFKTGSPTSVEIQAPGEGPTPTPGPSPTPSEPPIPTPTPTPSPTPTPTPTPTVTPTPTATPTPTPGQIVLRANGQRLGPHRKAVQLRWIGANPPRVDIFRNGVRIARVPTNPGTYTDVLFSPGLYTYKVCEAGSMNCSNEVTVRGP